MKSAIYMDGKRFIETEFALEENFEKVVKENSKTLFGTKTIYSDLKNKVESMTLGAAVPDGFLFDFKDEENPEFYLVEVELVRHDFFARANAQQAPDPVGDVQHSPGAPLVPKYTYDGSRPVETFCQRDPNGETIYRF